MANQKRNTRKEKLQDAEQLHGKTEPTSLAQIWGEDDKRYGSFTAEAYQNYINKLNKNDLYNHCLKHGVKPTKAASRSLTEKKLMAAFYKYSNNYRGMNVDQVQDKDLSQRTLDILQGRN